MKFNPEANNVRSGGSHLGSKAASALERQMVREVEAW